MESDCDSIGIETHYTLALMVNNTSKSYIWIGKNFNIIN